MTTHSFANPFQPFNPFLPREAQAVQADLIEEDVADARDVSYALVQSGPAVPADEVESHLEAIEVKVRWGTQVLKLSHLGAEKGFTLGEGGDFTVPELDAQRTSIVARRMGVAYAVVPDGATATVSARGEHSRPLAGGEEVALAEGMAVTMEIGSVTIEIASVRAGKKSPVGFFTALASGAAACIGLSFLGHTAIVASLAMFMPSMNPNDADTIDRDQMLYMQKMMTASADRPQDEVKDLLASTEPAGGGSTGGEPHAGPAGAAGQEKPVATPGHMSFRGADDHARLSRQEQLQLARESGLIGVLMATAPNGAMASPWATDTQMGTDAADKRGALFGATADDATGTGWGLSGTGEGGGGKGAGVGFDGMGDLIGGGGKGPGKWGIGRGDKDGLGNGHGPGKGGHLTKAPVMREMTLTSNGKLPPEVIQRIVRQNFGRFRLCYEAGLRNNPGLTGRVVTKFVIGRDGAVAQASDAGSDLANQEVVSCVVKSFNALSFPQPEGGIATVTYPISLSPGGE